MASVAQIRANRLNAQKSTGPRTPEGKAAASQNAVRHGLLAEKTVISGEDPGQFESYRAQLLAERIVGLAALDGLKRSAGMARSRKPSPSRSTPGRFTAA